MDAIRAWLDDNRWVRIALMAAAGVVLIVALAGGGWAWHRAREARAATAIGAAMALAQRAEGPPASPEARDRAIKALEEVMTEHPRASDIAQAAYELGNLRYAAGQYAGARGAYELALARGASGSIRNLAALGVAYTLEAEKNYAAAVPAYEAVVKGLGPKDFLYEEALVSLARAQELHGKPAAALELYQRALKDVPDTRRADELRARIAELKSRPKS